MKKHAFIIALVLAFCAVFTLNAQKSSPSSVRHLKNDGPNRVEEITIPGVPIPKTNTDALQPPTGPNQQGMGSGNQTPQSGNFGSPKPHTPSSKNPIKKVWKFCTKNFLIFIACTAGDFVLEELIDQLIDFNDGVQPSNQNNVNLIAGNGNMVCQNCSISVIPSNGGTNYTAIIREPNGTTHSGRVDGINKGQ
jgi:hypothetical protein